MPWNEVEVLQDYCKKHRMHRDWLLVVLGCSTGFRFAELRFLTWGDILGKTELSIAQGKQKGRKRTVPLHPHVNQVAVEAYAAAVAATPPSKRKVSNLLGAYIFKSQSNNSIGSDKPITRNGANDVLIRLCKAVAVDMRTSVHSQRKAWAIRMFELLGGDDNALIQVSEFLGHRDTATTRRYLGFTEAKKLETVLQIWDFKEADSPAAARANG